jgi:hypothetical protein
MRVKVTPEAETQLGIRRRWWRENRSNAADLFDQELEELIGRIERDPSAFAVFVERRGHVIRRGLMRKARCHLYFEVHPDGEVWVLGAGGGQQRRPPHFKLQDAP